jgi:sugar lactone lactonase YvrE
MSGAIRVFDAPVCALGEGPVRDAALGALHAIDAADRRRHRNDASGALTGSWALPRFAG